MNNENDVESSPINNNDESCPVDNHNNGPSATHIIHCVGADSNDCRFDTSTGRVGGHRR